MIYVVFLYYLRYWEYTNLYFVNILNDIHIGYPVFLVGSRRFLGCLRGNLKNLPSYCKAAGRSASRQATPATKAVSVTSSALVRRVNKPLITSKCRFTDQPLVQFPEANPGVDRLSLLANLWLQPLSHRGVGVSRFYNGFGYSDCPWRRREGR